MSNNFKFYINSYNYEKLENELKYVYVFIKNIYFENSEFISTEDLNENYSNDINSFIESKLYTDYFNDLFNDLDKIYINEFNPKIYFLNENIYEDDSIETIKFKFIKNYNNLQKEETSKICYEELYLFGLSNKKYNPLEIYNKLTNFGKNKLTNEVLMDYFTNINEQKEILEKLDTKEIYEYEDLYNINIKDINILTPIGQSVNSKFIFSYSINPFKINKFNNILKNTINSSINTLNSNFLFDYNLSTNSLFVTLFKDVNNYNDIKNIEDIEFIIKLYFPLLSDKSILSFEKFETNNKDLLLKTNNFINESNFYKKIN